MTDIDQAMRALALANDVRYKRAGDKEAITLGAMSASSVLHDPPAHWLGAKIIDLLLAEHRVGRVKAQKWLSQHRVSPNRSIESLTLRQRYELAGRIDLNARSRGQYAKLVNA